MNAFEAAAKGLADELLRLGPDAARATDEGGWTPMHYAALCGHVGAIEVLAKLAPETATAVDLWGETPMHKAAMYGHVGAIKALWKLAPETAAAVDEDGMTPMHHAAFHRHVGAIVTLAKLAPHTASMASKHNMTPLDMVNEQDLGHAIAEHAPLTREQWKSLKCPFRELERILPGVLARSRSEAGWLVEKLPAESKARIRGILLAAHRLGLPSGLETAWLA